jgi:hypothetical protein
LWHLPGLVGGRTITGPTAGNDTVFATVGMRGPLHAVRLADALAGDVSSQNAVAWKHTDSTPDTCCPVVWGDLLFVVADNGVASCCDVKSGRTVWKERLGGNFKATPIVAEGRIYFLNLSGTCTVVKVADKFEKLAENKIDDEFTHGGFRRTIFCGRKFMYAIGERGKHGQTQVVARLADSKDLPVRASWVRCAALGQRTMTSAAGSRCDHEKVPRGSDLINEIREILAKRSTNIACPITTGISPDRGPRRRRGCRRGQKENHPVLADTKPGRAESQVPWRRRKCAGGWKEGHRIVSKGSGCVIDRKRLVRRNNSCSTAKSMIHGFCVRCPG